MSVAAQPGQFNGLKYQRFRQVNSGRTRGVTDRQSNPCIVFILIHFHLNIYFRL